MVGEPDPLLDDSLPIGEDRLIARRATEGDTCRVDVRRQAVDDAGIRLEITAIGRTV